MGAGSLNGKTVLVTGGARGIGAETARRLVEQGANVALVDLRADEVHAVAERLGGRAAGFVADVCDERALAYAVAGAVERFGGIDVVVANAGIGYAETLATGPREHFEHTFQVNVVGPWNTVRASLPELRRSRGYVLVVASIAAVLHPPLLGSYAVSKAGAEALGNALRIELEVDGIDVGVAYFPFIDTPLVRDRILSGVGGLLVERFTYPLNRVLPVDRAGRAMVGGIARRARRVYAPRWVRGALVARALLPRAVEAQMRRAAVHEVLHEYDRERALEQEQDGQAQATVASG